MKTYDERTQDILKKADAEKGRIRRRRKALLIGLSSAAAVILALNLTLFVPYTVGGYDLSDYQSSEYYPLMQAIGKIAYAKQRTNNFEQWGLKSLLTPVGDVDMGAEAPPTSEGNAGSAASPDPVGGESGGSSSGNGTYDEVTDNQVAGVIEGDLFKRSDKYLWYLTGNYNEVLLLTYSLAGEDSKLVSSYSLTDDIVGNSYTFYFADEREMYLSEDANTVTVFFTGISGSVTTTYVITLDVSDPAAPAERSRFCLSGYYITSRKQDGKFLLVTDYTVYRHPDFSKPEQYLPRCGTSDDMQFLPLEDIVLPENAQSARYTVVSSFEEGGSQIGDAAAFFSYTSGVYVSEENIYTLHNYTETETHNGITCTTPMTEVCVTSYTDGLERLGTFSVEGTTVNQYSLDEKDGVLRMFTTCDRTPFRNGLNGISTAETDDEAFDAECNLFCISLSTFEPIAEVRDFAPGETVRSVRFDGDKAYVCTAIQINYILTDPVFEFDLSDYTNITSKDTGTIPGFSLNLRKFYGGTLLGIGYGEEYELKIEVYGMNETKVESYAVYTRYFSFSGQYKAYFIDAENGLVGLAVYGQIGHNPDYGYEYGYEYLLLRFDGRTFTELAHIPADRYISTDNTRACMKDGFLYVLFDERQPADSLHVQKIW